MNVFKAVKCGVCGKLLGNILDERIGGKRIYEFIETANVGIINGETGEVRGVTCNDCNNSSSQSIKEGEE